jgi:type I restriction enzyme, S subunit
MSNKNYQDRSFGKLLEESIIPEEEQPFIVPANWVWVRLNSYYNNVNEQKDPDGTENYVGLEHLEKGGGIREVATAEGIKSRKVIFNKGDVLYGKLRPYLNKHAVVNFDGIASTDILVYRSESPFSNKLLDYFLGLPFVVKYANENSSGINLPRVSPKTMNKLQFPLPPLAEQKRMVEKIETQLAKIEEAKSLIEEAKETFEIRHAAILDKAFRGELTVKERQENNSVDYVLEEVNQIKNKIKMFGRNSNTLKIKPVTEEETQLKLPDGWSWVKLGELSYYITSGSRDWSKYYSDKGVMFIRTQDINTNKLNLENVAFMDLPNKIEGKRSLVEKSDILTTITGANVGKCALVDEEIDEAYVSQSVALTKLVDKEMAKYIHYSLLSPIGGGGELLDRAYGIGRPVLSLEDIKNIKIPLAPKNEREKIVKLLDNLLNLHEKANEIIKIEGKLDLIKDSIVSKAFRGELGTNDPNEESILELLKEILYKKAGR